MRYVTGNCKPFLDLLFPAAVGDFSPLERPTEGRPAGVQNQDLHALNRIIVIVLWP
jgi:hypothetical protein